MAYEISLLPAVRRHFARLDPAARRRIGALIDSLATQPRPAGVKALKGMPDLLRVRAGDYRVVYRVEDRRLLILVVAVGHRREVYPTSRRTCCLPGASSESPPGWLAR